MNAQANILKKNGILGQTFTEVEKFLINTRNTTHSSNEIFSNIPTSLRNKIITIASTYTRGACSSAASCVGTVASMLVKNKPNYIHDHHHYCTVLKRFDDGFVAK